MRVFMMIAAFSVAWDCSAEAGPFRRSRRSTGSASVTATATPQSATARPAARPAAQPVAAGGTVVENALPEVNAARARRGLRPFAYDPSLGLAALRCAQLRAANRIEGHLSNDFAHLPAGVSAKSAGCGALEPSWGWGTCCTYDNYTQAGAAWAMGADGKRYMHLFVR
jgi:hypothetical protein